MAGRGFSMEEVRKVGRPGVGLQEISVGIPKGLIEKLDEMAGEGGRRAFIRGAVEAALEHGIERKPAAAVKPVVDRDALRPKVPAEKLPDDCRTLLAAVKAAISEREGVPVGLTCREAARLLDWPVSRTGGAEEVLSKYDFIHYPKGGGVMYAVEGK
jgi:hypothetical protein